MEGKNYIELLELQNRIKESIADAFPGRYWVKAEIASWSPRANGHCYLTLSQSRTGKSIAEARAMIWKWKYPLLTQFFESSTGQRLQAGLTVLVQVTVSYSELYGVSLFIEDIDPAFTLGEQALERKKAIEKLTAQGYMEMQKELALPDLPYRLAVITSKTAAGYQDFRHHLLDNPEGYAFQLDLFEALMQGEQAPASIMEALEIAGEKNYDAILILRGGGSELDLACFDDYDLAVAIATCPVPVVTAIGHDKDVHIADMVAHASVKTPTALADLFLDAYEAQDAILDRLAQRIGGSLQRLVSGSELRVAQADAAIRQAVQRRIGQLDVLLQRSMSRISRGLLHKYADVARLKDNAVHRVQFAAQARVSAEVSKVALKEALIKASDPRSILALGYVLVTGKDNKVLKTVDKVSRGDRIGVRFSDGSLTAKVDEIYSDKIDNNQVKTA
ncbi:MAG: exodeoxyribonuclease VII large subunit [Bacteroidales bacterium]|jgi:exodeoxyribonuclease VII large subunit|nr:exodeoxyribonuclease VII large subunit [Bacteroidales bacterium]